MCYNKWLVAASVLVTVFTLGNAGYCQSTTTTSMLNHTTGEVVTDHKLVIYQMMVRLFGNKNTNNKTYGSKEENGVGKFNDITVKALSELKKLGVSHVWYTGVIEHATMTDYTAYGVGYDDPDIVKGKAGSPYAIKDYYDVDPDLATDVRNRMAEYDALVKRTHAQGLKVIMDFVPNHVARTYNSDAKPAGVRNFGEDDDKTKAFSVTNDFYYIPSQPFIVPAGVNPGGPDFHHPMKDGRFDENPARATGNDVFAAQPNINDWFETIKLNYGVDYQNGRKTYFEPIPPVWLKMRDILTFWANKNVDGFRCDMAEMVPVEFWQWVIPQVKKVNPAIIFIGEAYDPKKFSNFFTVGKFDYLYDKVGLYDALKRLIKDEPNASVNDITHVWKNESRGFSSRMLRFLENHDEERIASAGFAKDPAFARPAMIVSATLSSGPIMIYSGQEVGEPGNGIEGFSGEDNRTTIFDYWGIPNHQKWMNDGRFDGAGLTPDHKRLRSFYSKLLNFTTTNEAVRAGQFYELLNQPGLTNQGYAYMRYTSRVRTLVVANFNRTTSLETTITFPAELIKTLRLSANKIYTVKHLFKGRTVRLTNILKGIKVTVPPSDAVVLVF